MKEINNEEFEECKENNENTENIENQSLQSEHKMSEQIHSLKLMPINQLKEFIDSLYESKKKQGNSI